MRRFEIWVVSLDPVVGSEMQKPRPAVVISPDEMNNRLNTVLVAPLTRRGFVAPFRVPCQFAGSPARSPWTMFAPWTSDGWRGGWANSIQSRRRLC